MNSNPTIMRNFRETFGIIGKNNIRYRDILEAYIEARIISVNDLYIGFLKDIYQIHIDNKAYKEIMQNNEAKCIISYQKRTTGNFAMIRLFKKELLK